MDRRQVLVTGSAALAAATVAPGSFAKMANRRVATARLERFSSGSGMQFVPVGEFLSKAVNEGYIEEEWVASGVDDLGMAYRTQVFVRRPRDPAIFTGTVIVEPLHFDGIAPIYMYSSPYILRSGHGWVCIASQKTALEKHVKGRDAQRYASLDIGTDYQESLPPRPSPGGSPGELNDFLAKVARVNQASSAILAEVGSAIREPSGPFGRVRNLLLVGHSQTGFVSTEYIKTHHASCRLSNGGPIYDGFLPSGSPGEPFGPRDVPLIQVISDGDVFDAQARLLRADNPGRHYRRPDSDLATDRYRLYELASVPHLGTRYPPSSDPKVSGPRQGGLIKPTDTMNSLPHDELFNMALNHLVRWSGSGDVPPRADRIETAADGRFFAKDENGNSRGGVRCVQLDVPRATYFPVPINADGNQAWATVGTEVSFPAAKMQALYGTPEGYRMRFNQRLDELIAAGWFLPDDAKNMRAEAAAQIW